MFNSSAFTSDPQVTEIRCTICQQNAKITLLTIRPPNDTPTIISTFECENCNIREPLSHEQAYDDKLTVECKIDSKDDLKREVNLPKLSVVKFDGFEYTSAYSQIMPVEAIIRKIGDEMSGLYGIGSISGSVSSLKNSIGSAHNSKNSSSMNSTDDKQESASGSINNKKESASSSSNSLKKNETAKSSKETNANAEDNMNKLRNMLSNPDFLLIIEDPTGMARISGIDQPVSELLGVHVEEIQDEKVKYTRKSKE